MQNKFMVRRLLLVPLVFALGGCTLIAEVDRQKIPTENTGGSGGSGGSEEDGGGGEADAETEASVSDDGATSTPDAETPDAEAPDAETSEDAAGDDAAPDAGGATVDAATDAPAAD
jgi:hypothetical protein